jgi:hypothetical protein
VDVGSQPEVPVSKFVVAIPLGQARDDVVRATDLLAALQTYEPAARVVLIDDAARARATGARARVRAARAPARPPAARNLDRLAVSHPDLTVLPNPRYGRGAPTLGGLCVATVTALAWAREHAPGALCLRINTDALVIAPFARAIEAALGGGADVGVVGSCDRTCDGEHRTRDGSAGAVAQHARPLWFDRRPPRRGRIVQQALVGRNAAVRRELRAALAAGYDPGRRCLGNSYAVSAELIAAMAGAGMLEDPLRWRDTLIGDDVMVAVRAAALGFELRDLNDVFGIYHVEVPDSPQRLAERGFAIVQVARKGARFDEAAIRSYFRARRGE